MVKRFFSGAPAVFIIALLFATCSLDGTIDDLRKEANEKTSEVWLAVSSVSQIQGTWSGPYGATMTMKQFYDYSNGPEDIWDYEMENSFPGIKISIYEERAITINSIGSVTGSSVFTIRFQGGSIVSLWYGEDGLREGLEAEGFFCNDSNYSAQMSRPITDTINASNIGLFRINPSGNKLWVPMDPQGMPNMPNYMIMTKQ